jgi:hypothetical protein
MHESTEAELKVIKEMSITRNPLSPELRVVLENRGKWFTSDITDEKIQGEANKLGVYIEVHPNPASTSGGYFAMAPR